MLSLRQDVAIAYQSGEEAHRLAVLRRIRLLIHIYWWDGNGVACISADCVVRELDGSWKPVETARWAVLVH